MRLKTLRRIAVIQAIIPRGLPLIKRRPSNIKPPRLTLRR
jgi:hypothetical protein